MGRNVCRLKGGCKKLGTMTEVRRLEEHAGAEKKDLNKWEGGRTQRDCEVQEDSEEKEEQSRNRSLPSDIHRA